MSWLPKRFVLLPRVHPTWVVAARDSSSRSSSRRAPAGGKPGGWALGDTWIPLRTNVG